MTRTGKLMSYGPAVAKVYPGGWFHFDGFRPDVEALVRVVRANDGFFRIVEIRFAQPRPDDSLQTISKRARMMFADVFTAAEAMANLSHVAVELERVWHKPTELPEWDWESAVDHFVTRRFNQKMEVERAETFDPPNGRLTRDFLQRIANASGTAIMRGESPAQYILARSPGKSLAAVRKWLQKARDAGLLQPQQTKGEQ